MDTLGYNKISEFHFECTIVYFGPPHSCAKQVRVIELSACSKIYTIFYILSAYGHKSLTIKYVEKSIVGA